MENLTALGYGIVTLAIVIGIGTVVLSKFGGSVATCSGGTADIYNSSLDLCHQISNTTNSSTPTGSWVQVNYLSTQLGQSGLSGWVPAIIALVVGMLFLGMFMARKGRTA